MNEPQKFGHSWTVQKLNAVEEYLKFYTTALKNKSFNLCYIDAFSGSGNITLKDGQIIDGSALRALQYPFDAYYFFEKNEEYYTTLREKVETSYSNKLEKIEIVNGDCNKLLNDIDQGTWTFENWRGVIFLDPYAMDLGWTSLEKISKTKIFDVWYLFPFSAVTRNLPNSGIIQQANEEKLTRIFGSSDWKQHIYQTSPQQTLFDDLTNLEKIPNGLEDYLQKRLQETFPTVAPNPARLYNEKNSPLFLLCFAGSNPSIKAKRLSLKGANYILNHV